MSTVANGARRTFFAGCQMLLIRIAGSFSRGTTRLDAWADWCGKRAL